MRAVVGLGNPGKKYEYTRHNVGFLVVDRLAEKYNLGFKPSTHEYYYSEGRIDDTSDFILIKPSTYMNMSGAAIKALMQEYSLNSEDIIVIYDDLNLEAGRIRPRKSGNDGGHNGVRSIIMHLETESFPRIRFGIGNKFEKGKMVDFVLSKFSDSEMKLIEPHMSFTIDILEQFLRNGIQFMLDYYSKLSNTGGNATVVPGT